MTRHLTLTVTMRAMLGKRKREALVATRSVEEANNDLLQEASSQPDESDIFRQYFEAWFEPLPSVTTSVPPLSEDTELEGSGRSAEDSEWEGISEDEAESEMVQIVEHGVIPKVNEEPVHKSELRRFMSAKPPMRNFDSPKQKPLDAEEEAAETVNLKHDLDLHRLLKESHLLEKSRDTVKPGSHRHQAVDLRLQTLGSKTSLFDQNKMPLSHRKGIAAKAISKEAKRRQDAKENGVILERSAKVRKSASTKKDPDIGAPAVGKFRGGTLKLSRRDVFQIQGPVRSTKGGKRGRR